MGLLGGNPQGLRALFAIAAQMRSGRDRGKSQEKNRGDHGQPAYAKPEETQPDLFTAIQQQLGLKLVSTKAQVDVLVIDKVEKPSEN